MVEIICETLVEAMEHVGRDQCQQIKRVNNNWIMTLYYPEM